MLKEKLSYSFAKTLLEKPFELIKYELEHPKAPTKAMDTGNRFEYILRNGAKDLAVFMDTATKGKKFDEFLANKQVENPLYIDHPFLVVVDDEYRQAKDLLLYVDPKLVSIFRNSAYQTHFTLNTYTDVHTDEKHPLGCIAHGYTDFEDSDAVYDLKVTDPTPTEFSKQVLNMRWDIQCWLYSQRKHKFKWVVISPNPPYTQRIYAVSDRSFLESGQKAFLQARDLFLKFNEQDGVEENILQLLDAPYFIKNYI